MNFFQSIAETNTNRERFVACERFYIQCEGAKEEESFLFSVAPRH